MADLSFMKLAVPARGVYGLMQGGNRPQPANGVRAALPPARMAADTSDPIPQALRKPMQDTGVNPSFRDLAMAISKSNGGKISLNQLNSLADVAYKVSPRQVQRSPTYKDVAAAQYLGMAQQQLEANQAMAQQLIADGQEAKGIEMGKSAVREFMEAQRSVLGAKIDPLALPPGMPEDEGY
jgi:hypothetical protein